MKKRSAWVHVKATPGERVQWQAAAQAANLTLSDLIRQSLALALATSSTPALVGRSPPRPPRRPAPPPADPVLLRELARIGNNINQLAKWAHTYKSGVDQAVLLVNLAIIRADFLSLLPHTNAETYDAHQVP